MVGNKCDQEKDRKVSYEEGMRLAKENRIDFVESSAKNGTNIEEIFTKLNDRILERIDKGTIDVSNHPGIKTGTETYSNLAFEPKKDTT